MMCGVVGEMIFRGDLTQFLPYLRLGEILHIGKGTAYGLGRYSLTVLDAGEGDNQFGFAAE